MSQSPRRKHANALLHNGQGAGNDFLGGVGLPSALGEEELQAIETEAARLRDLAEVILCIGIGGSYLGARAVYEALSDPFNLLHEHPAKPILLFAGQNLSEDYLARLLAAVENRSIAAIVISKSGTTTEPAIAFRLIRDEIERRYGRKEAARRIVAVTDRSRGALKTLADREGYRSRRRESTFAPYWPVHAKWNGRRPTESRSTKIPQLVMPPYGISSTGRDS